MLVLSIPACTQTSSDVSTLPPLPFLNQTKKTIPVSSSDSSQLARIPGGGYDTPNSSIPSVMIEERIRPTPLEAKAQGQLFQDPPQSFPPLRLTNSGSGSETVKTVSSMKVVERSLPRHNLENALSSFLDHKPQEALQFLTRYERTDQEIILALLPTIAAAEQPFLDRSAEQRQSVIETLESLKQRLVEKAPLKLRNITFCQGNGVTSFGVVTPRSQPHFKPGDHLQLYAEVENLSDRKTADGKYQVRIESEVRIFDEQGEKWNATRQTPIPASLSQRHDFFVYAHLTLPSDMATGNYRLTLRITDLDTGRTVEQTIPVQVASNQRAAK